jgi:hypothetical protein
MPRGGFDVVGANVLRDATGFARRHLGAADVVQQRGLAVVHVAHDGDHRRARQQLGVCDPHLFVGEGFRIVQRRHHGLVAHFFHHDHGGVLVQRLVDGDHLAHLHQRLDHFGGLDRHLVCQLGHRDGFRHVHFDDPGFDRCGVLVIVALIAVATTAATGATTPVVAAHATTSVAAGLDFLLLGRSPAQLEDSLADLTSLPEPRRGRPVRQHPHCVGLCRYQRQACAGCPSWRRPRRQAWLLAWVPRASWPPAPSWAQPSSRGWPRLPPGPCGGALPDRGHAPLLLRHGPWLSGCLFAGFIGLGGSGQPLRPAARV